MTTDLVVRAPRPRRNSARTDHPGTVNLPRNVTVSTLMIQDALDDPTTTIKLGPIDLRALHPLIWSHVTPYGTFSIDLAQRLALST